MSGHSKWATIKRKKGANDAQRAKVLTKIGREIVVAVRTGGGGDPTTNAKLRAVIAKAKANNVPNDNIARSIKKGEGDTSSGNYEEIVYEGYGAAGVAVIVEATTDNKNRTAADMRHYFDKQGGNLGQSGSVSFMFQRLGVIMLEGIDESAQDDIMLEALDAGAQDIEFNEDMCEIKTEVKDFQKVHEYFEGKGFSISQAEIQYVPNTYANVDNEADQAKLEKLFDLLDNNDDVMNYYHNMEE
ncbi:MAG: YebC/PmpR family DNA-binding transcriptional regulator [Clostridiales bacterium]|jgi:YebC/PmpR family DNA-binding regulatory protein|nr:YebC/PmpR family DNA-binding transcriptional regulator [Clostridiales bacterium]